MAWVPDHSVLFAGDLLFNGGTPFLLTGSVLGAIDVLENLLAPLGARTIVPGHGPVCGPEVIDEVLDYLRFVRDVAARAARPALRRWRRRGADLGRYAQWSDPERIVGNLHRAYAELSGTAEQRAARSTPRRLADMVVYNGGRPLTCRA